MDTLDVLVEVSFLGEGLLAQKALERPLTRVDSQMVDNIALLSKAFVAPLVATEQFLDGSVRIFVFLEADGVFSNFLEDLSVGLPPHFSPFIGHIIVFSVLIDVNERNAFVGR